MYKEYFGLKELPFSIAPDPRYLYLSSQHREALAHLLYGMNSDGGFVLLTGEVGTGKTTVCRCLLDQIPQNIDVAFILNPKMTVEELLATICDELRIEYPQGNSSIKVFVDHINKYLIDNHAKGRKTVLIIEEAQNLGTDVLEQIRLLTNLETNQQKLLQIIMLGQPELRDKLSRPELRQLSQRITARYHLGSLSRQEVSEYVNHRLSIAGVHRKLFPDSVISTLHRVSNGIPRLINLICDRALLGTYAQGKDTVDKETLIKASNEISGQSSFQWVSKKTLSWAVPAVILILLAIIAFVVTPQRREKITPSSLSAKENPQLSNIDWPEEIPIRESKKLAYTALLKQWDFINKKDINRPCKHVQAYGLRCLNETGTMQSLIKLNRPAILKIFDSQKRNFYVTLTSIHDQVANVIIGTETRLVDVKEISSRWRGEYILLWRMPEGYNGYIHYGSRGPLVIWLNEQLSLIQGSRIQTMKEPVFDDELAQRVKEFQIAKGLNPDGIVGPKTLIHLNSDVGKGAPVILNE